MNKSFVKIAVRSAATTGAVIVLYELCNELLIYRYIRLDYYIGLAVIIALTTGIIISKKIYSNKIVEDTPDPVMLLTTREFQILLLIEAGKTNKEIASLNFVEISTVKTHINNLYAKLGVKNRKEAANLCRMHLETQKSTLSPPSFS